jgi:hypothetical protein
MKIGEIFKKDINRTIKGVITVGGTEDTSEIKQELEEYVVTREILKHMRTLYTNYNKSIDGKTTEIGVWVSGFFGSGKSHFERINAALLENGTIDGKEAIEYFIEDGKITDEMLIADIRRASSIPTDVIQFNIDSRSEMTGKHSKEAIGYVLLKVFNEMQGFCGAIPLVADIERNLSKKGLYEDFKVKFAEIYGSEWIDSRDEFDYVQDEVVEALVEIGAMSEEAARNTCEKIALNYSMDTEAFAKLVKSYIDSKGKNHHVVFVIDEIGQYIGDDDDLMLNLQTVAEDLGKICQGQAWIMVTSQQDIDSITKTRSDNFSKIQGRFATRLSLSSTNVDEVIRERILKKNQTGYESLCLLYDEKESHIKNTILWNDEINKPLYSDRDNFAEVYPFIPYQFNMLGSILTAIRTYGASGKHLADGERSMLALFKEAAVRLKDREPGELVPLHMFYDSLEQFLDHSHSSVISRAFDNLYLNPDHEENNFTINVLKTLFLIKYIKEIVPNVENITSLMVSHVDDERMKLQIKVEKALELLVKQMLVSRNGNLYIFLTNEEQEINRSISAMPVELDERTRMISELIFEEIYTENKFRCAKFGNRYNFGFKQMVDEKIYKSNHDFPLTLRILTPDSDEATTDDGTMRFLSGQDNVVLVVLPQNRAFIDELVSAKQIEKYMTSGASGNLDKYEQIKAGKNAEIRDKKRNAKIFLEDSLKNAVIYVGGDRIQSNAKDIRSKINEGLEKLVNSLYHKLSYITTPVGENDILSTLNDNGEQITLDGEAVKTNEFAVNDVREYIERNTAQKHAKTSLKSLIDTFKSAPYGFIDLDVQWIVAKLLKQGDITLYLNGEIINLLNKDAKELLRYLTRKEYAEKLMIELKTKAGQTQIKAVKGVIKDLFGVSCISTDEDVIMRDFKRYAENMKRELERIEYNFTAQPKYPGKSIVTKGKRLLNEILAIQFPLEFFNTVKAMEDELLDFGEDYEPIKKFFGTRENPGEQKQIFDDVLKILGIYEKSKTYIVDREIEETADEIKRIISNPKPYNEIYKLPPLRDTFIQANVKLLSDMAKPVKAAVSDARTRVFEELDGKLCKPKLSDKYVRLFQELKDKADSCNDVAALQSIPVEADALKVRCLNEIAQMEEKLTPVTPSPAPNDTTESVTPQPVAKPVKKRKSVSIRTVNTAATWQIETEEDVKKYIAELEKRLIDTLEENTVINVEF